MLWSILYISLITESVHALIYSSFHNVVNIIVFVSHLVYNYNHHVSLSTELVSLAEFSWDTGLKLGSRPHWLLTS